MLETSKSTENLISFIPSLTKHIESFLPYVIDKENYESVKLEGATFFENKKKEDYGNFLLAVNEFSKGQVEKALDRIDFVVKQFPRFKAGHHLRVVILAKLSTHKEYHNAYRKALIDTLKTYPEDHDMRALLANHQIDKEGEKEKALQNFQEIIHHRSHNYDAWLDLAFSYLINRELQMAEKCLLTSLKINPTNLRAILMSGIFLCEYNKYEEAIKLLEQAEITFGKDKSLMRNLALLNLQVGNREKGWEFYSKIKHEDRVSLDRNPHTEAIKQLEIDDLKSLKKLVNKKKNHVLVYFEQGIGDYIMFSRYLNMLSDQGFKVTAFGQKDVVEMFNNSNQFKKIKFESTLYPDDFKKFSYKTFIQDLPFLLMDKVIPEPTKFDKKVIIKKKKFLVENLKKKFIKGTKKIGVSWKGNKRHIYDKLRRIDIEQFSEIFKKNKNIQFFVIDRDISPHERKVLSKFSNVTNCEDIINSWEDTLAICFLMDEMVCVDTSLGHIAGTLGIPTNLLIARNNDWRWGINKEKTEWYKSVTLYRQKAFLEWSPVLKRVINYLKN